MWFQLSELLENKIEMNPMTCPVLCESSLDTDVHIWISYKTKDLHLFCNLAFLGSNGSHHVMVINSPLIDSWLFTPYSHPQAATRLACGCDQVWKPSQATQETLPILSSSSAEQPAAQSLLISRSGPVLPSTRYITIPMHFRSALKSANASGASYIRLSSA